MNYEYYFLVRHRFGKGWFSASISILRDLLPRQLPLTEGIQKEFTTRKA